MPAITVMIKPASGLCNMRCRYCFYTDETQNRTVASYGLMSPETLEAVLRRVLAFATGSCTIAFQGGEPTLAGLDFFRRVIELEQQWNINRCTIHNAMQTNGYNLDEEWARFLAENHFLVGLSLDGPQPLHDENRLDAAGKGTFNRVMRTVQLFRKHGVDFNILTVVTAATCRSVRKIWHFFERNQLEYQQYIPCLDPLGEARGGHPWSLTPERYARFLKDLFDCWYEDVSHGHQRYNRYFDNLLQIMAGQVPEACGMLGVCGRQYVVEADGGVYPCDFYMLDEWRLGNFVTDTFEQIEKKRQELGFIAMSAPQHPDCQICQWKALCRGGCRRDREPFADGAFAINYFCPAYAEFFTYAWPRLQQVLQIIRRGNL